MESKFDGRYFLLDVPSVEDDKLKNAVGDLIGYRGGIHSVHWLKAAEKEEGGIVGLDIDEKAAKLLREHPTDLNIGGKTIVFSDRMQLITKVSSTIDDDVLQLVKDELSRGETGMSYANLVSNLKLTKFRHNDGYDCWRIEGTFKDVEAFEQEIRKLLFQGIKEPRAPRPNKTTIEKRYRGKGGKTKTANRSSQDRSEDFEEPLLFTGIVAHPRVHSTPVPVEKKIVLITKNYLPVTFEFYIGDLTKEEGVSAIVNPTDVNLDADINPLSQSIKMAMGPLVYEKLRLDTLEFGCRPTLSQAVLMQGGNLPVDYVVHVAMPNFSYVEEKDAMAVLSMCYGNVLDSMKSQHIMSIATPPLGIESGVPKVIAAGGAVMALVNAASASTCPLGDYVDVIRFVFTDAGTMHYFVDTFTPYFDSIRQTASDKLQKAVDETLAEQCGICLEEFTIGSTKDEIRDCGHKFHLKCIQKWLNVKKNCPTCAANGKSTKPVLK